MLRKEGNVYVLEVPLRQSRTKPWKLTHGRRRGTLRCDNEPAIEALPREIARARQEGSLTVPERPPGIIERMAGLVAGQARTLEAALEHRIGASTG